MNRRILFEQLLPNQLPDEAAFILWECFRELMMVCEEKCHLQISREYALRVMQDELDEQPVKDHRQIEIPF